MESESQVIDISRVSGFMQKVGEAARTVLMVLLTLYVRIGSERCDIVDWYYMAMNGRGPGVTLL